VRLPAVAAPVAFFRGFKDSFAIGEIHIRFNLWFLPVDLITERAVHGIGIYDFPGIEDPMGVETFFDPLQELVVFLPDHHRDKLGPDDPVAVFPAKTAAVPFGEACHFGCYAAEKGDIR